MRTSQAKTLDCVTSWANCQSDRDCQSDQSSWGIDLRMAPRAERFGPAAYAHTPQQTSATSADHLRSMHTAQAHFDSAHSGSPQIAPAHIVLAELDQARIDRGEETRAAVQRLEVRASPDWPSTRPRHLTCRPKYSPFRACRRNRNRYRQATDWGREVSLLARKPREAFCFCLMCSAKKCAKRPCLHLPRLRNMRGGIIRTSPG